MYFDTETQGLKNLSNCHFINTGSFLLYLGGLLPYEIQIIDRLHKIFLLLQALQVYRLFSTPIK